MILTSHTIKSYLVASILFMLHDKLKQQVSQQFLSRDQFILSHSMTFILRVGYIHHDCETHTAEAVTDVFLV